MGFPYKHRNFWWALPAHQAFKTVIGLYFTTVKPYMPSRHIYEYAMSKLKLVNILYRQLQFELIKRRHKCTCIQCN